MLRSTRRASVAPSSSALRLGNHRTAAAAGDGSLNPPVARRKIEMLHGTTDGGKPRSTVSEAEPAPILPRYGSDARA